jgi:CRP-like cAMP-binding protein
MAAPVELLRRVSLFAGLDEADLRELSDRCQERTFGQGSPVTSAGSRGAGCFIIDRGEATVRVNGEVRRRLHRGDYFGELALIDGGRRAADITADSDLHCWGLSEKAFRAFVTSHPAVAWALLERVVGMLREGQAREARATPGSRKRRIGRRPPRTSTR